MTTIDKCRKILKEHQCRKIAGVMVDASTAHVIVTVHDALSEENAAKFAEFEIVRMADVAWKLVK